MFNEAGVRLFLVEGSVVAEPAADVFVAGLISCQVCWKHHFINTGRGHTRDALFKSQRKVSLTLYAFPTRTAVTLIFLTIDHGPARGDEMPPRCKGYPRTSARTVSVQLIQLLPSFYFNKTVPGLGRPVEGDL